MRLSIIIVSYNVCDDLLKCLEAIISRVANRDLHIIVVDNASSDGTVKAVQVRYPDVQLVALSRNLGFAGANNIGIDLSTGENILFLNPDTIPSDHFFIRMLEVLDNNPGAGAVGPRAYWDQDHRFLISSLKIPSSSTLFLTHSRLGSKAALQQFFHPFWKADWEYWTRGPEPFPVPAIGGAYTMVRRSALDSIGGDMDERFFLGYEDVDLSLGLQKRGWGLLCVPEAKIVHSYGASKRKAPEYMEYCTSWHAGPGSYMAKHHGKIQSLAASCILGLEAAVKSMVRHSPQNAELESCSRCAEADILLEWPIQNKDDVYLAEIATSPTFFDKFGTLVKENSLLLDASVLVRLATGRYYYRVIRLPASIENIVFSGDFTLKTNHESV